VPAARGLWNALLAPGALVLLALFLVPLGMVAVFSFGTIDILGRPVVGFSLDNFEQVVQPYNLPAVGRTLAFATATTLACLLVGYPVAYAAVRFAGRLGPVLIALVVVPWLVDYLVRIYAWRTLLSDEGLVNRLLGEVGLGPASLLGTPWAVIGGLVYGYLPLMILPLYASLGTFDMRQIEAGKDLYGTPRQTFWHVTLPATRAGVVGGCLLVFLPVLGDFATAEFLGGPGTTMIGNLIATQFNESGAHTVGSAFAVVLILALVLALALTWALARRGLRQVAEVAA
jgi:spermidine/putrescine transport system permease protein